MDTKPIWASKTFWANIIGAAVSLGTVFGLELSDPEQQTALVGGIMAAVNIVLRLITDKPVRMK